MFGTGVEDREPLVEHFRSHGWVAVDAVRPGDADALAGWVNEIAALPDRAGGVLQHFEGTDAGPVLCRSENFVPVHAGLRSLLCEGPLLEVASALLGEPAVLYKEKINYKLPGGAGYAPHQDAPAYPFIAAHVSCMVAVDDADERNGCLEVVSGRHHDVLPMDDGGCITRDVVAAMEWFVVPVRAGQTLWFHSRTPHRSGPNLTSVPRRALYPTYNALSEGDLRDDYYREKLEQFRTGGGRADGLVQVSLIDDFQGRPVPDDRGGTEPT